MSLQQQNEQQQQTEATQKQCQRQALWTLQVNMKHM
jgi:hypothetical protein